MFYTKNREFNRNRHLICIHVVPSFPPFIPTEERYTLPLNNDHPNRYFVSISNICTEFQSLNFLLLLLATYAGHAWLAMQMTRMFVERVTLPTFAWKRNGPTQMPPCTGTVVLWFHPTFSVPAHIPSPLHNRRTVRTYLFETRLWPVRQESATGVHRFSFRTITFYCLPL